MVLSALVCAVILATGYEYLQAQPNPAAPDLKIGVVSVHKALRNCQATKKFRNHILAEQERMDAEEEKLSKETKLLAESLTAFKRGSAEYMERLEQMLEKQTRLKTLQELNPSRKRFKEMQWTQNLYQEILRLTKEVAAAKGLNLVLGADEPEFPYQRYEELVMTLSTHKVLYNDGCVDITNEVIAELDKIQSRFKIP
jgi:Skp family chaperone for outer membrane proteins